MLVLQLAVGFGLLSCIAAPLQVAYASRMTVGVAGLALFAWTVAHVIWFRTRAPRAIVATDEFLGITRHGADQQRIPWSSIFSAVHSTGQLGMQWQLDIVPNGTVVLRDVGIDAGRWGVLRAIIIDSVGMHGNVLVDPISEGIYGERL
jgi:hypothetical protein